MLKMVAPEASYEEISGRISQNRDFQFGGKFVWCLFPAQELVPGFPSKSRKFWTMFWGSWACLEGFVDGSWRPWKGVRKAIGSIEVVFG